jgi:hypothetical protein
MDLRAVVRAGEAHGFHTAIAMIPIDYASTRRRVAELVRRHADRLSLVPHGVDHRTREFKADVTPAQARERLLQGVARMEEHRRRSGLDHAHAMTFPFGHCNPTWMRAMREIGFDGAFASRAHPFRSEEEIDEPLFEMLPAELSFEGFPMINRFRAEDPVEALLFQAWLGKPLVIYTHHDFFREGTGRAEEIAAYLNRRVGPEWSSLAAILESNVQTRGDALRAFANSVRVPDGIGVVAKPAAGLPDDEAVFAGVHELPARRTARGIAAELEPGAARRVRFGPRRRPVADQRLRIAPKARVRRLATEARDQGLARAYDLRGARR